jgi:hypothetical protein
MQREMKNIHKISVRNTEEKNPLGRLRHDREYKIRMKLTEIVCEGVKWIHLAQDTV